MAKIQYRGNCQCCGRDQAVVDGHMSKHGYTVENGWFQGVCSGHKYAPMQNDISVTFKIVNQVESDIEALHKQIADLKSGKVYPKNIEMGTIRNPNSVPFKEAPEYKQREAVQSAIWKTEARIRAGEGFVKDMTELAKACFGKELRVVKKEKEDLVKVGAQVKVWGKVVTVTKIEYATVRGVGPNINGQVVEHVFWNDEGGREFKYPKRLARAVK